MLGYGVYPARSEKSLSHGDLLNRHEEKIVLLRYSNFGGGEEGGRLTDHLSSVTKVYRFFSGAGVFDFSSLEIPPFSALIFIGRVAKLNNRERDSNGERSLEEKRCSRGVCFFRERR